MTQTPKPPQVGAAAPPAHHDNAAKYSMEQALSDQAQLHTIAFDGMAWITGGFDYDTFLPPGKMADYFGFQYMRDIDAVHGGHNTSFLTNIADNTLAILNAEQKAQLLTLAKKQQADLQTFAEMRLPLIKAFRDNMDGRLPAGSKGLDQAAVMNYSAKLYELDGKLAAERAEVMGAVIQSFTPEQKAALAKLKFGDSSTWPAIPEKHEPGMNHEENVAVMTYASDMFSWYAGSVDADVYFCPERHGMYFGGFGMKTAPAMGKQNYSISTSLTSDSGAFFLQTLNADQRKLITDIIPAQHADLMEIVAVRKQIVAELLKLRDGGTAEEKMIIALSRRYGQLDGEMSWMYATAFAKVGQTLTADQKQTLLGARKFDPSDAKGPFLYSTQVKDPKIANTDFLFGVM